MKDFQKEIIETLKECKKNHQDCEINIKALIVEVNGKEKKLTLKGCPPNGCPTCPPIC